MKWSWQWRYSSGQASYLHIYVLFWNEKHWVRNKKYGWRSQKWSIRFTEKATLSHENPSHSRSLLRRDVFTYERWKWYLEIHNNSMRVRNQVFSGRGRFRFEGVDFWERRDIHSIIRWFCREKRVWSDINRSYCEEYQSCFGNGNSGIQKPLRRRILERKAINMHFKKEVFQPRVHFELHPKGINNDWSSFDKQRRVSSQGRETRPNIFFCRTREWRRIGDFKND